MRLETANNQSIDASKDIGALASKSLEKISTGLKINQASDDGAGLFISDKLRTQASGIKQGIENIQSAQKLMDLADKGMDDMSNILDIIKQKSIQMATDTTSLEGREALRKEIIKLIDQYDEICYCTNYNGLYPLLLNGDDMNFGTGQNEHGTATISTTIDNITSCSVGLGSPYNLHHFRESFSGASECPVYIPIDDVCEDTNGYMTSNNKPMDLEDGQGLTVTLNGPIENLDNNIGTIGTDDIYNFIVDADDKNNLLHNTETNILEFCKDTKTTLNISNLGADEDKVDNEDIIIITGADSGQIATIDISNGLIDNGLNATISFSSETGELIIDTQEILRMSIKDDKVIDNDQVETHYKEEYSKTDINGNPLSYPDNIETLLYTLDKEMNTFEVNIENFTDNNSNDSINIKDSTGSIVASIDSLGNIISSDPNIIINQDLVTNQVKIEFLDIQDQLKVYATDDIKDSQKPTVDPIKYNLEQGSSSANNTSFTFHNQVIKPSGYNDGDDIELFGIPKEADNTDIDISDLRDTESLYIRDSSGNELARIDDSDGDGNLDLTVTDGTNINFSISGTNLNLSPINATFDIDTSVSIIQDDTARFPINTDFFSPNFTIVPTQIDSDGDGVDDTNRYTFDDFTDAKATDSLGILQTNEGYNNDKNILNLGLSSTFKEGFNLFNNLTSNASQITMSTISFATYPGETLRLTANGSTFDVTTTTMNNLKGTRNNLVDTTGDGNMDSVLLSDPNVADVYFPVTLDTTGNISSITKDSMIINNIQGDLSARIFGGADLAVNNFVVDIPNATITNMQINATDITVPTITHKSMTHSHINETADTRIPKDINISTPKYTEHKKVNFNFEEALDCSSGLVNDADKENYSFDSMASLAKSIEDSFGINDDITSANFNKPNVEVTIEDGRFVFQNNCDVDVDIDISNNGNELFSSAFSALDQPIPPNGKISSDVILTDKPISGITPPDIDVRELPLETNLKEQAKILMQVIDMALTQLNSARSEYASTSNQLDSALNVGGASYIQLKYAQSILIDTEYGEEMANINKAEILAIANTYAMIESSAKKMEDFIDSLFK